MKIGFCGIGLMGAPMVKRMLDSGYQVAVYNRSQSKALELQSYGATVVDSPKHLSDSCTHVFLCLFDWQAVEGVVFGDQGLIHGKNLKCVIDHSSLPVDKTIQFSNKLKENINAQWIDAPVSGGVAGAEQGTLAIMAGGDKKRLESIEKIMLSYAKTITHMGGVGTGQTTKLCNQAIVSTTIAAIAEAVALAQKNGVDASLLNMALAGGWADSVLLQTFVPRMTATDTPATATIDTMLKDINNIYNLAADSGVSLPINSAIKSLYDAGTENGLGHKDVSRIIDTYNI